MASRRGSATAQVILSKPFKIYHENHSSGKHIEGSKRKLRWRFGWTDDELEHEVDFNHTLTSGKKKIIEDGREITTSSSIFSTEFSHGWNSNGHMFRVEANTPIGGDPVYIFSIDGVKFENFMEKPLPGSSSKNEDSVRPTQKQEPVKRATSTVASAPVASAKPAASKPVVTSSDSFDPFAPSANQTADPFAPAPTAAAADPFAPTTSNASVDPFATAPAKKQADPFAPAATKQQVDPFAPVVARQEVDPFAPVVARQEVDPFAPKAGVQAGFANPQNSDDPFFSGASTAKKPFAPPAGSQATFAAQAVNAPARRQSAIEIMGDFAGLTADVPPPAPVSVMLPEPVPNKPASSAKEVPTDPWASLVNLDLNKPQNDAPQRRASINSGPALNSQLKPDDQSRRGSMPAASGPSNPFGPASSPGPAMGGDPFAQTQPFQSRPFGQQQPQYGGGMGGGPAPNPFGPGSTSGNFGQNTMGYGGVMGGSGMGLGGSGMGGTYGAPAGGMGYQQQPPQSKKSSLDSLDPFKM